MRRQYGRVADARALFGADCPLMSDQRKPVGGAASSLISPASKRVVVVSRVLLIAAVVSVTGSAVVEFGAMPSEQSVRLSSLLFGIALSMAAAAIVFAIQDRMQRDRLGARRTWRIVAIGVGAFFGMPALAFATGMPAQPASWSATAGLAICAFGVIVAARSFPTGSAIVRWPRGVIWIDTLVGAAGTLLLAYTLAGPVIAADLPLQLRARPIFDAIAVLAVVFLCAKSRQPSGFGAKPLGLLVSAVYVYVATDVAAILWPGDWWSIPPQLLLVSGAILAAALVVFAVSQPAVSLRTSSDDRNRRAVAAAAPLVPIVVAVVVAVYRSGQDRDSGMLAAATLITTVSLAVLGLWRLLIADGHVEELEQTRSGFEVTTDRAWFRTLVGQASDVVTVTDLAGRIVYQTPSVTRVLGYDPERSCRRPFAEFIAAGDVELLSGAMASAARNPNQPRSIELTMCHRDGSWRDTETKVTVLPGDGGLHGFVLTTRDISDRRRINETLERRAEIDDLTGLPNRSALRRHVSAALDGVASAHVAVLALDLDGFRALNDTLGHQLGDEILCQVAGALRRCVRPWDVVARIGGDEFAVLIAGTNSEQSVVRVQERLRRALAAVVVGSGDEIRLAHSAGYALNDSGIETADELLRNADLALARARTAHRVDLLRFEAPMHEALLLRVHAEQELRAALSARQLELAYQPMIDLSSGAVIGAEALVRWRHPQRGLVAAGEFVPLAEEMGIVHELGIWALRQACRDLGTIKSELVGSSPFKMSVNVSGHQIEQDLVDEVMSAASDAGICATDLVLEVTESVLARRPEEVAGVLQGLRSLGCQVALDDFGTGYSSLSYLAQFPVDILKIDRSFVADVGSNSQRLALTRTIVGLAQALHLATVAEGVETAEQADLLRGMGCESAQGYLFSRPVQLSALLAFLSVRADATVDGAGTGVALTKPRPPKGGPTPGTDRKSDRVVVITDSATASASDRTAPGPRQGTRMDIRRPTS